MKNKKLIIIIALIAILAVGGISVVSYLNKDKEEGSGNNNNTPTEKTDAIKFKEEYESLNGTVRESDGAAYNNVTIPEVNNVKYVTIQEAISIIENESAVIYVGANWCPWCRNAVPVLLQAADNYSMPVYYLNFDNEKSTYEVKDGQLVQTKAGTEDYYKLLEKLSSVLRDYTLTDKDGKVYDTKEKRIYMPFVFSVKDGEVLDTHTGTVSLNEDQDKYSDLTKDQADELYKTYAEIFKKVSSVEVCDESCS